MKRKTRIGIVLCISVVFFLAEVTVGVRNRSLALIADAYHYLNDIVAYAVAFIATHLHEKGRLDKKFTFSFLRAEIVGAFFNGVFLLGLALSIFVRSLERFVSLTEVESPFEVLVVGGVGFCLNVVCFFICHEHGGHKHDSAAKPAIDGKSNDQPRDGIQTNLPDDDTKPSPVVHTGTMNLLGALVHLFGDAINNIAVIISASVIWKLRSPIRFYADPTVSLFISLVIFGSAIPLTWKAALMLLETTPSSIDLERIKDEILETADDISLHDLHAWHLSETVLSASLHVCVPPGTSLENWEKIKQNVERCFTTKGVHHVTTSVEIHRDLAIDGSKEEILAGLYCTASQNVFGCAPPMAPELRYRGHNKSVGNDSGNVSM